MQFTTAIFATLFAATMAAPAPAENNAIADHSAFVRRLAAISEAPSATINKRCDHKKFKECAEPCSAFTYNPGGGISQALCIQSCNNISGGDC
ncbi:unnamed protein product [Periconia digitata]|uniref:Uncharacterized protein n=1 Tax=Periconia digitata TaxID=1303443 RepID=A0A9W4UC91_9PLEO|nr:unnamed protein product [Periconia digitata]